MPKTDLEFHGHDHPAVDVWRLYFEWPNNPLPMNGGRGNRYRQAATVRWVRDLAVWRARAAKIPKMARVRVQLTGPGFVVTITRLQAIA